MTNLHHNFLTEQQEKKLISLWQQSNDPQYSKSLLLSFKPLMRNVVKKYKHYGISSEDLIQEACLGLCIALTKYEVNRGVRFSSYAKWWVNARCQDYVMRNWSIVRVGTTTAHKRLFFQLRYLKNSLETLDTSFLDTISAEHIAKKLHTTIAEVQLMYGRLLQKDMYLDQKINEEFATTFADVLVDESEPMDTILIKAQKQKEYFAIRYRFKEFLDERELNILLKHRIAEPPQTLEDISAYYGLTKERIRQIEKRAIRKLKKAFMALGIRSVGQ